MLNFPWQSPDAKPIRMPTFALLILVLLPLLASAAVKPVKSPNDQSDYRYLTLNNGLQVLLVSDPKADMAAASLDVAVGSADDPDDRAGLAHFLEHMLFLGTEKYPEPGEYQQFIKSHGGTHNAFTAFQDTNFFFDIQADQLEPALDRFAQQFSAPLFTSKLVDRERQAVHSEFSSGLKDDSRRVYSAKKAIANPDSAFSKFSVGNQTTLANTSARPLRPDLVRFWRQHYSANLMTLAVYGPQSLDQLAAMVKPRFSAIENRHLSASTHAKPIYKPGQLPELLKVHSLKDMRSLSLSFPIPSQRDFYHSKPDDYIANLLGHEGPGSLLDTLKKAGLVDGLSAGTGMDSGQQATLEISMSLTPDGLAQRNRIIQLTFAYIDKIRQHGIDKQRFEEMKRLAQINFRFRERPSPIRQVSRLSMQLQHVNPRDVVQAAWIMDEYAPQRYRAILKRLTPDNVLITVVSPEQLPDNARKTRWYDAAYTVTSLDPATLAGQPNQALASQLALPAPNPFIPDDLALVPGQSMPHPILLGSRADQGLKVWFARDTRFDTPKANVYLSLRSPATMASARNHVLTQLLVDAINNNLNAYAYPAQLAGLDYRVYTHLRGVTIRVGGYSSKLHTLLNRILTQVANPDITRQRFEIARQNLIDGLRNQSQERPVQQASEFLQSALIEGTWTTAEKLSAARSVTLDDLRDFAHELTAKVDPVMLVHGNVTEAGALNLAALARALVTSDSQFVKVPRSQVRDLPSGETDVSLTVSHPDTGYLLYMQGRNTSFAERADYRLLGQILSSPFYEEIRTNKQLGYVVYATPYEMLETPALGFIVQSPGATGEEIDNAARSFVRTFTQTLEDMSDADLTREKQAVISKLLEQDRQLGDVSERYWQEIDRSEDNFDSREKLADAVRSVSAKQLLERYKTSVLKRRSSLKIVTTSAKTDSGEVMTYLRKQPPVN